MAYFPTQEQLTLFRSMAVDEYRSMPAETTLPRSPLLRTRVPVEGEERATLAQLRAAVRLLNRLGAIKPEWLEKYGQG